MVNLYKLTNLLESGMTIFQLNQWKNEGIWYPITQYKKESNEIEVVTNVFTPLSEENPRFHIQLSANYDTEKAEWNQFLEDNQWKLYPLLRNILNVFLPPHEPGYRILYTLYPEGFLSVIAEPLKNPLFIILSFNSQMLVNAPSIILVIMVTSITLLPDYLASQSAPCYNTHQYAYTIYISIRIE